MIFTRQLIEYPVSQHMSRSMCHTLTETSNSILLFGLSRKGSPLRCTSRNWVGKVGSKSAAQGGTAWRSDEGMKFCVEAAVSAAQNWDWIRRKNIHFFHSEKQLKHRVTIPCKWSFEKQRFSRKAALFRNGLPSVLYETPGLNERSVLNQLFLMISGAFHMKSTMLFTKSATFHEKHNAFHMKSAAFHMKSTAFHFELLGDDQV